MNIGVFFPSLSFNIIKSELIDIGINNLKDLGCNVVLAENCFDNMCGANIAGSPETRAKALQSMLNDDNIDIIMSAIGGYGSVQLIDKLDFQKISKRKKIIGFSDVTHLLFPLYDFTNADVYLGPAFINFCNPYITDNTKKCFESIILDDVKEFDYVSPKNFYEDDWYKNVDRKSLPKDCLGYNFIKGGVVVGPCVGGNLPSMLDLFGTNYKPIIKQGTILLIEVVSTDSPEIIMDQFYKLKLTGAFDRISGLIVGKISAENILSDDNVLGEFLNNLLQDYNFPIVIGAMFTHLEPLYTMQFGSLIRIDSNNKTIKMVKRRDFCGK